MRYGSRTVCYKLKFGCYSLRKQSRLKGGLTDHSPLWQILWIHWQYFFSPFALLWDFPKHLNLTDCGVSLLTHPIFGIHFNSINNAYSICSDSLDLPRGVAHGALLPLSQHQQHNLQVPLQNEHVGPSSKIKNLEWKSHSIKLGAGLPKHRALWDCSDHTPRQPALPPMAFPTVSLSREQCGWNNQKESWHVKTEPSNQCQLQEHSYPPFLKLNGHLLRILR